MLDVQIQSGPQTEAEPPTQAREAVPKETTGHTFGGASGPPQLRTNNLEHLSVHSFMRLCSSANRREQTDDEQGKEKHLTDTTVC